MIGLSVGALLGAAIMAPAGLMDRSDPYEPGTLLCVYFDAEAVARQVVVARGSENPVRDQEVAEGMIGYAPGFSHAPRDRWVSLYVGQPEPGTREGLEAYDGPPPPRAPCEKLAAVKKLSDQRADTPP